MSLSDTAEYWWDIKNKPYKHTFTHIKGVDCGHYHVCETKLMDSIDCYACLELIKNDPQIKELVETANANELLQRKNNEENKKKQYRDKLLRKHRNNPKCSCGFPFVKRVNHKSRNNFWGCSNYPKCKQTKSI